MLNINFYLYSLIFDICFGLYLATYRRKYRRIEIVFSIISTFLDATLTTTFFIQIAFKLTRRFNIYVSIVRIIIEVTLGLIIFEYHIALKILIYFALVFIFFEGRSKRIHGNAPKFEMGISKAPVIKNSKCILHGGESVIVLQEFGKRLLIRKLNGEEHYVDSSFIAEEDHII